MDQFEHAIRARNPVLAGKLQPGLAEAKIRKKLQRAGVEGDIEPIVELFAWKDGSHLDGSENESESPFPGSNYIFSDFDMMTAHFKQFKEFAAFHTRYAKVAGRFYPIFWNGSTLWVALDLFQGRVVLINGDDENPVREVCESFESFIREAIKANENGKPMDCIL